MFLEGYVVLQNVRLSFCYYFQGPFLSMSHRRVVYMFSHVFFLALVLLN